MSQSNVEQTINREACIPLPSCTKQTTTIDTYLLKRFHCCNMSQSNVGQTVDRETCVAVPKALGSSVAFRPHIKYQQKFFCLAVQNRHVTIATYVVEKRKLASAQRFQI